MNNPYNFISRLISEYKLSQGDPELCASITSNSVSSVALRDILLEIGDVLDEDLENSAYIATVKTGLFNIASSVVGAMVCDKTVYIVCIAHEGLLQQNLSIKTVTRLAERFKNAEVHYETHG